MHKYREWLIAALILLVCLSLSAGTYWLLHEPSVSGDDCPAVDTDAPPNAASRECWEQFAAVGVFICPTEAHPDWLTALAPRCPP